MGSGYTSESSDAEQCLGVAIAEREEPDGFVPAGLSGRGRSGDRLSIGGPKVCQQSDASIHLIT